MTHSTPDDLFDHFKPPTRSRPSDPPTSKAAAEKVAPVAGTIRAAVERFAKAAKQGGFIDEDLSAEFGAENVSSYRTRRAELTECNIILDSGRTAKNAAGNDCVVWLHRDFVSQPPMIREPSKRPSADATAEAFGILNAWQKQMKNEGRLFAPQLAEAIETARRASQ